MGHTQKLQRKPRKVKRFRFVFVHTWLTETYEPCRVADIAGGKGMLTYLLQQSGWDSIVIDPEYQELPPKYTDINRKRIKLPPEAKVPRLSEKFTQEMAEKYDLLVGIHAHGCNMQIIEAAAKYKKDFVLLPCCVIEEPIEKRYGVNWRESLVDYAKTLGLEPKKINFNFVGKSIAIYTDKYMCMRENPNHELLAAITQPLPTNIASDSSCTRMYPDQPSES